MTTYVGFSTKNACAPKVAPTPTGVDGGTGSITRQFTTSRKFRLTDEELVIQDFVNALNIPQGQKPGNPAYGTTLWGFVFEPNTPDVQFQLEQEIRRVANLDPRLLLDSVVTYPQENGILVEVEIAVKPSNQVEKLQLFFDQNTNSVS